MNLINTSEAAAIGIHAMAMMAADTAQTFSVAAIAERLGVSVNHCSKVMQRLHKSGLVAAVRGPGGGYRLARSPAEITPAQIIEAIEGKLDSKACLFHQAECRFGECLFGDVLRETCEKLNDYLNHTTLAMLVEERGNNGGLK